MSKRLQVILDEEEYREIKSTARRNRMTVAEWVRISLRQARAGEPTRSVEEKLETVRRAVGYDFPTGDIEEVLADIDRGRSAGQTG
ncbi:MAG: antitoxin [Actinomycetota bacterium]